MPEIIGRNLEVGFATEATRKTAESSVDKWVRNTSANIVERAVMVQDDSKRGVLEDMEQRRVVQKYIEGSIEGIAQVDAIGYLYSSLYGKVASSIVSGSVYDHEFTMKQNIEHQSLTLFAKDGGVQQLKFGGCMVSSLELNIGVEDFLRYTANIIGNNGEEDSETPRYDTEYDFIAKDITIKFGDTEGDLATAEETKIKSLSLTHDQTGIRDHVFGGFNPDDVYNANNSIVGEISMNFTDETFKDLYLGDDSKYMQITIQGDRKSVV